MKKVPLLILDVTNQVRKWRLKSRGFKIKITALVMYEKIEKSKEATSKEFKDLKVRKKV